MWICPYIKATATWMNDLVSEFVKTFFDYVNLNTGKQLENFSAGFWLRFSKARHHTQLSVVATTEHTVAHKAHPTGELTVKRKVKAQVSCLRQSV